MALTPSTARPVVVVGGGPSGMTAAALLARLGVETLVFERETSIVSLPRAVHFDDEVMRIFDRAGFARDVSAVSTAIRGMQLVNRDRELLVSFARDGQGLHGFPRSHGFDQPELEAAMRGALSRQPGVTVRAGASVEGVESLGGQDAPLRVRVRDVRSGERETLEASAVLACDGARSGLRASVGGELEDLGFDGTWLVVDVETPEPLPFYEGCIQVADPLRPTTYVCPGRGRHRWEFMLVGDETPAAMTDERRVRALLWPWLGALAATITVRRRAVYTFHALIARRYRRGRLFLLGDAAHQMPPFIGQGMGAGVLDAANLTWKLAAVLGGAPDALLDTYALERRPHVRRVMAQAVLLGRAMRTDFGGRWRDRILRLGAIPSVQAFAVKRAFPSYERGPLVRAGVWARGPARAGEHVPRASVAIDGRVTDFDEALGEGFALVVRGRADGRGWAGRVVRIRHPGEAAAAGDVVDREGTLARWLDESKAEAALVRPDRVVFAAGGAAHVPRWAAALGVRMGDATIRRRG